MAWVGAIGVLVAALAAATEADLAHTGRILSGSKRIFLRPTGEIAYNVHWLDVIRDPEGVETERREHEVQYANIATHVPLRWSGKFIPLERAVTSFVTVRIITK